MLQLHNDRLLLQICEENTVPFLSFCRAIAITMMVHSGCNLHRACILMMLHDTPRFTSTCMIVNLRTLHELLIKLAPAYGDVFAGGIANCLQSTFTTSQIRDLLHRVPLLKHTAGCSWKRVVGDCSHIQAF